LDHGTYSLEFLSSVERALGKLPRVVQQRVRQAIDALAHDPRPAGAKLLSGSGDERIWRLRVGDYRVLYQVHDDRLVVLVVRVAGRGNAYRQTELQRLVDVLRRRQT